MIREDYHVVYGDSGYVGIEAQEEIANDVNLAGKEYKICKKHGKMKGIRRNGFRWADRDEEQSKSMASGALSSVAYRNDVKKEFAFHFMKDTFGYRIS